MTDELEDLHSEILDELEAVGATGIDPLILAARVDSSLNETVTALEVLADDDRVEPLHGPTHNGRYRLTIDSPEVQN